MRLHRLELQAFQAFPGREVVDLDALGAAGLFLLHGDTGAGKTTLLDAVCFALYGRLPGARGKHARERSDHATAACRTEVVLEATLRGERVRISRSPRQARPKRRGTGLTEEAATVHLERAEADGWRTLATRQDEAGAELERLVGMSRDQFCQVVLLPQGEFATFLRADSDTRWEVLERLFATERFGMAEDELTRRRKEAGAVLEQARGAVREVAQRICQQLGCDAEADWEAEPDALAPWLQERLVSAEASEITARAACGRATAARTDAEAALRTAEELEQRARRHAEASAAVALLEAARPERDAAAAELFAAREAAGVAPLLDEADRAEAVAASADARMRSSLDALGLLTAEPEPLRDDAARLRAQAGAASGLAAVEAELAGRRAALEAERGICAEQAAESKRLSRQLTDGPSRRGRLAEEYSEARRAADTLSERRTAAEDATARREAARSRDRLTGELERQHGLQHEAIDAEQAARQRWLDVRQARLDGMAGELARGLGDDRACPVCGAVEHPAPAPQAPDAADADTERAAQDAYETEAERRRQLEQRRSELAGELAAARARAGDATLDALARGQADADRALAAGRRAAGSVDTLFNALAAFDEEQRALGAQREVAAAGATAAAARVAEWEEGLRADERRLRSALGEASTVAARVETLRQDAERREQAAEALTAAVAARRGAEEARVRLVDAARSAGFADLAAARAARRSPAEVSALEAQLSEFDATLAERRGSAADPELRAAADAPLPDLDELRLMARGAAEEQARGEREDEVARRHAHALRGLERRLTEALEALAPVAERARVVRELAHLVDGSAAANRKRMRLSAYVLAARLEEIAAVATVRLAEMTDGRYTIEHSDAGAKGHRRGGLDLVMVDGWTGDRRDPATLSGGETFLASLALALALADVVTAESGGARLETLFVDEGFGALDPASLDLVLDVLDRLRDGGRAVGIVSHVGELRQRVAAQLHVVKGREGSHVERPLAA